MSLHPINQVEEMLGLEVMHGRAPLHSKTLCNLNSKESDSNLTSGMIDITCHKCLWVVLNNIKDTLKRCPQSDVEMMTVRKNCVEKALGIWRADAPN